MPYLQSDLNLVEATIAELRHALQSRSITAVDLLSRYLARIATFDASGPTLNSICVLNPDAFAEAQRCDDWIASGRTPRPLEGIPYTVKDSYKVKGMTMAAGSPAFADLVATEDCYVVEKLREAGAVLIGRTNMPPMADGGCQRGVYGRAESPYNSEYLTAAFASGSSNGSATSTAASFAAFGMGGETVSSGRSPASNNGLVGYSPSRGVISCRGAWPLYPTCDVLVAHTRTMCDLFEVLDVLVADDHRTEGDFWREQSYVPIPPASQIRPASYVALSSRDTLRGKRIGVPKCYIGHQDSAKSPAHISSSVEQLWERARQDLVALGAEVVETDFPVVSNYESKSALGQSCYVKGAPDGWNDIERNQMIALSWDDFLRQNDDSKLPSFLSVDTTKIHPKVAPMDDQSAYTESQNIVQYEDMKAQVRSRKGALHQIPGCGKALQALEDARVRDLETWMDDQSLDLAVFPTAGDVAGADSELFVESRDNALREGVKYSNGGRAIKHLGIPALTVPMGEISDNGMPVGLTFLSKAYDDTAILQYAFAFEQATRRRTAPSRTPSLSTDSIPLLPHVPKSRETSGEAPHLSIQDHCLSVATDGTAGKGVLQIYGSFSCPSTTRLVSIDIFVRGSYAGCADIRGDLWFWRATIDLGKINDRFPTERAVPRDRMMVQALARATNGRCAGAFVLVDPKAS